MSPTYDETGRPADRRRLYFAEPVRLTRIELTHDEVSLFDGDTEVLLISRGSYPGAGMAVNLADHLRFEGG